MSAPMLDGTRPAVTGSNDHDGELATMRLVKAVQDLSLARSLDTVINIVRCAARELSRADGASFILRDEEKCYYVDEDAIAPLWKGQRFPMAICISGWSMKHRRPAAIKDIYADDRIPFDAYRPTFVRSLVMVPIRAEDPIGAIGIYWAQHHSASDFEIQLLQTLANSTAVAMENVQLYAQLEQRVQDRTRQLEEANKELETFSYSVSHDLQAPLRHVTAYAELLANDHRETMTDEARGYLDRIQKSAAKMGGLMTDLMRLARFSRVELHPEQVDLSKMAEEIAAGLREDAPQRNVEFKIAPGVIAEADAALLRIVLQNLLSNAGKFTSKRDHAVIECGVDRQADAPATYFVRDNGVGFDMRYAKNLFGPFQRLHNEADFSGSGIGLATVERIVRHHGGRIWADSVPDQGTVFSFTLTAPSRATAIDTSSPRNGTAATDGHISS